MNLKPELTTTASENHPNSENFTPAPDGRWLTVVSTTHGQAIGKSFALVEGVVKKSTAADFDEYVAQSVAIPDLAALQALLAALTPAQCVILGCIPAAGYAQYRLNSASWFERRLDLPKGDGRKCVGAIDLGDGITRFGRFKDNFVACRYVLIDRDSNPAMPASLHADEAGFFAQMERAWPGFADAGKLIVASSSNRVVRDGKPVNSSPSQHVYVELAAPDWNLWDQLRTRLEARAINAGLGFPTFSKAGAQLKRAIFDISVLTASRFVFEGAPLVRAPLGLENADSRLLPGPALGFPDPLAPAESKEYTQRSGNKISESGRKVSVSNDTVLTWETPIETEVGIMTVKAYHASGRGKMRCQTPFRDSSTWNGILNRTGTGRPFVHDNGAGVTYFLPDEAPKPAREEGYWESLLKEDAQPAQEVPKKRPGTFKNLSTLLLSPPAENWLIRGFFAEDSVSVIFGESGCGKTFVAIDLLCHIACGLPWLGERVRQGKALYIAGEGQNGLIRRFKAWFQAHPGHDGAQSMIELRTLPAALCNPEATAILAQEIADMPEKPVAIVVDTLARNFGPGDENSTRDMTQFVAGLDALRAVSQAAIIVPHHSGHGEKNRGRGSSVLRAAIDTEYHVDRDEATARVRMRCTKMKDSEPPKNAAWKLAQQALPWAGQNGTFMNSAVLVPTFDGFEEEQSGTFYPKQRLSPSHRIALDALRNALIQHGIEADGVVTVAEDQWRQAAYSAGISGSEKPDSAKKAFQRARQELVAAKRVNTQNGCYWLGGTKRDKTGQCPEMSRGMSGTEAGQNGTHPYKGCPVVPSVPDTQPTPNKEHGDVPPLNPSSLRCTWNGAQRLVTKCAAPDVQRNAAGEVVGCKHCGGGQ